MTEKKTKCRHKERLMVGIAIDEKKNTMERMYRCTKCNKYFYEEMED